jgi:hypothetical protein
MSKIQEILYVISKLTDISFDDGVYFKGIQLDPSETIGNVIFILFEKKCGIERESILYISKDVPDSKFPNQLSNIELFVKCKSLTSFLLRSNSTFKKLIQTYLSKYKLEESEIKFYFNETEIDPNKTPLDV